MYVHFILRQLGTRVTLVFTWSPYLPHTQRSGERVALHLRSAVAVLISQQRGLDQPFEFHTRCEGMHEQARLRPISEFLRRRETRQSSFQIRKLQDVLVQEPGFLKA